MKLKAINMPGPDKLFSKSIKDILWYQSFRSKNIFDGFGEMQLLLRPQFSEFRFVLDISISIFVELQYQWFYFSKIEDRYGKRL